MRTRAIVLSTTMAMVVLTGCSAGNVFELTVGDCFDAVGASSEEIRKVSMVACDEPHDLEVFHIVDLADGDFPGDPALMAQVEEMCIPAFEEYVGTDWPNSRLDIFPLTPTQSSWDGGDREIVCAVVDPDGAELTGSVKGSGQ